MRDCIHQIGHVQNEWFGTKQAGDGTVNRRFLASVISLGLLTGIVYFGAGTLLSQEQAHENGVDEAMISQQARAIVPTSGQLVEEAIAVLSKGWTEMSRPEQEAFLTLYDPAGTGEIDQAFVEATLANYQKIQEALRQEITVVYEPDSKKCEGMRLYYTDLLKLHVCPYFLTEGNDVRKARTLIHEMAHIALRVTDRPYYRPTNKAYAQLTPTGSPLVQLPVVGPVIRELQHSDTLYHPDAYAHFTVAVSGQPVAAGMYSNQHDAADAAGLTVQQPAAADLQVADSWALGS
jgi:hypothetical protein